MIKSIQVVDFLLVFNSFFDFDLLRDISEVSKALERELTSFNSIKTDVFNKFTGWNALVALRRNHTASEIDSSHSVA